MKRYVLQFKSPQHIRWQPTAWSTDDLGAAQRVSTHYKGKDNERVWDRKARKEVSV